MAISFQPIDSPEAREKFEQIYQTYRGLMFRIAMDILQNAQDAEDAVHNACLAIAKSLPRLPEPASPRTRSYVAIVCESRAIDFYRKRKRERGEPLSDLDELRAAPVEDSGVSDLAGCISRLSPRDQEIILLRYEHGYTVREIADILSLTVESVSKRDWRARQRLAAICEQAGIL